MTIHTEFRDRGEVCTEGDRLHCMRGRRRRMILGKLLFTFSLSFVVSNWKRMIVVILFLLILLFNILWFFCAWGIVCSTQLLFEPGEKNNEEERGAILFSISLYVVCCGWKDITRVSHEISIFIQLREMSSLICRQTHAYTHILYIYCCIKNTIAAVIKPEWPIVWSSQDWWNHVLKITFSCLWPPLFSTWLWQYRGSKGGG